MRPSFLSFFLKTAATLAPSNQHQQKLDEHFTSGDKKKWRDFKRNLRARTFAEAVANDERADKKLKTFAKMVSMHLTGKGPSVKVPSQTSGKWYTVKYHDEPKRWSCSCPDWTYVKCLKPDGDCKHIEEVRSQVDMVQKAASALAGAGRALQMIYNREKNEEQAWHAGQVNKIHKAIAKERKLRGM